MATIQKKIWPKDFKLVKSGRKRFEWRVADFRIKKGDIFILAEYNPATRKYSGRKITRKVKEVVKYSLNQYGQKKLLEKKGFYIIHL